MSDFTKGPWFASCKWYESDPFIGTQDGIGDIAQNVCALGSDDDKKEVAALIAAAPDMHEACVDIEQPVIVAIQMLRREGRPVSHELADDLAESLGKLRDALAKATNSKG